MKVTIEEIEGVPHSVVWYVDPSGKYKNERWQLPNSPPTRWINLALCKILHALVPTGFNVAKTAHAATALPPLPRHPTKDDAVLLHLYAAHGLEVMVNDTSALFDIMEHQKGFNCNEEYEPLSTGITHALTESGERVDIAITDRGE